MQEMRDKKTGWKPPDAPGSGRYKYNRLAYAKVRFNACVVAVAGCVRVVGPGRLPQVPRNPTEPIGVHKCDYLPTCEKPVRTDLWDSALHCLMPSVYTHVCVIAYIRCFPVRLTFFFFGEDSAGNQGGVGEKRRRDADRPHAVSVQSHAV